MNSELSQEERSWLKQIEIETDQNKLSELLAKIVASSEEKRLRIVTAPRLLPPLHNPPLTPLLPVISESKKGGITVGASAGK